ncbi:hypothetical protein RRG08_022182, partial [Elysia crispata]
RCISLTSTSCCLIIFSFLRRPRQSSSMAWSTVVSLLILFLRTSSGDPLLTSIRFEYTETCSDSYLVEEQDILLFEFEAKGNNSAYPFNYDRGPKLIYTHESSTGPYSPCRLFQRGTNACEDNLGEPNKCSCVEVQASRVYRFILNLTAHRFFSKKSVWMEWPGPPTILSKSYKIPEIEALNATVCDIFVSVSCPKIKFLRFQSPLNDHKDFLVAGEDTTVIQFEVSGNNSVHSFMGKDGPQFYYTTTDGVAHKGCLGFDPDTGSCTKRTGVRDACSCEMKNSTKYWLSYNKTATVNTSRATVYLVWPGRPDLRSDSYTFPEITASPALVRGTATRIVKDSDHRKMIIIIGTAVLVAVVVTAGFTFYEKFDASRVAE